MTKQTARIDQWTLIRTRTGHALLGRVSDHDRQADFIAAYQQTSRVILFDPVNNTAETMNTIYTLGEPA